jgi:hypothetical protein
MIRRKRSLSYLQKRLIELDNARGKAILLGIIGSIIFGFFWNVWLEYDFAVGFILVIAISIAISVPLDGYYKKEKMKMFFEIQQITRSIPKCANCGKEIPQGNFDFCPFCGNSLKKWDLGTKIDGL